MGPNCTRNCGFCNIEPGPPAPLNPEEPGLVALSAAEMGLKHVVITSVTRDDLPDGGADHFVVTAKAVRERLPEAAIELLTPDFQGSVDALKRLAEAPFDVFNHNVETAPRLYAEARAAADYQQSLLVLKTFGELRPDVLLKSGVMLGLGERDEEVEQVLDDLRQHGVRAITIGQYLQPRRDCLPVRRYVTPENFALWHQKALERGFSHVAAGPFVRSSYLADRLFNEGTPLAPGDSDVSE